MDYMWIIIAEDLATGSKQPLVGYELEEDANDDWRNRPDDEHYNYSVVSIPYYKTQRS